MSIENPKHYSRGEQNEIEKNRIQDPSAAHAEANMLKMEAGDNPTAEDYDEALHLLELLKEDSHFAGVHSPRMQKVLMALTVIGGGALDLFTRSLLAAGTTVFGPLVAPKEQREMIRKELIEKLKAVPADYKELVDQAESARVRLEEWKAKAEEAASTQRG